MVGHSAHNNQMGQWQEALAEQLAEKHPKKAKKLATHRPDGCVLDAHMVGRRIVEAKMMGLSRRFLREVFLGRLIGVFVSTMSGGPTATMSTPVEGTTILLDSMR